jgi:hypothetical protein
MVVARREVMPIDTDPQSAGLYRQRPGSEDKALAAIGCAILSLVTLGVLDDAAPDSTEASVRGAQRDSS